MRAAQCRIAILKLTSVAAVLAFLLAPTAAAGESRAEEAPPDEPSAEERQDVAGRERATREADDSIRDTGDVILWLPREVVRYTLLGEALVARLANEEQLVPRSRYRERAQTAPQLYVFPTLFADTERSFSIGARMIAASGPFVTSARVGFGGPHDLVAASKVQYQPTLGVVPLAITVEGLAESSTAVEYHGVGQVPEEDARNQYVAGAPDSIGLYEERRSLVLAGLGVRPIDDLQLFSGVSLARRQVEDEEDADGHALSQVFVPGTVALPGPDTWIAYSETALRVDTRAAIGPPLPGVFAEIYGGYGAAVRGPDISLARAGGRIAGFIPIYRDSNILSPRLVLDTVTDLGDAPLPFTELARQATYRGADTRRDHVSLVGSLDYIWGITRAISTRVFLDAATVGPEIQALAFDHLRVAGGFGLDLHSDTSTIASASLAGSADGVHFHLSIGTKEPFGNRHEGE